MSDTTEMAAAIEARLDAVLPKLREWAAHMAARFNGPVYLVGSMLHNPLARDCDIRIIVADHEFAARYGMPMQEIPEEKRRERNGVTRHAGVPFDAGVTQRWIDDIAKFTGHLSVTLGLNVDIKVWPDSYWREPYPTPITLAAPSPGWSLYNAYHPKPAAIVEWEAEEAARLATDSDTGAPR